MICCWMPAPYTAMWQIEGMNRCSFSVLEISKGLPNLGDMWGPFKFLPAPGKLELLLLLTPSSDRGTPIWEGCRGSCSWTPSMLTWSPAATALWVFFRLGSLDLRNTMGVGKGGQWQLKSFDWGSWAAGKMSPLPLVPSLGKAHGKLLLNSSQSGRRQAYRYPFLVRKFSLREFSQIGHVFSGRNWMNTCKLAISTKRAVIFPVEM